MGNFYTNIVVTESRTEAVTAAVEALERRAYVVTNGRATLVFDERCDRQDVDELQRLAGMLSKQLHCAALAFCNHDDDILWYALAQNGQVVDTYDSFPGYFTGGSDTSRLPCDSTARSTRPNVAARSGASHTVNA